MRSERFANLCVRRSTRDRGCGSACCTSGQFSSLPYVVSGETGPRSEAQLLRARIHPTSPDAFRGHITVEGEVVPFQFDVFDNPMSLVAWDLLESRSSDRESVIIEIRRQDGSHSKHSASLTRGDENIRQTFLAFNDGSLDQLSVGNAQRPRSARSSADEFEYDVAVSFAGEQRPLVHQIVQMLRDAGVTVFYDEDEKAALWGRDLVEALDDVYRKNAFRVLMFISEEYADKFWPTHERRAAMARSIRETNGVYILPVRLDDTDISGLPPTLSHLDARDTEPEGIVETVLDHLEQAGRILGLQPTIWKQRREESMKISLSSVVIPDEQGSRVQYRIKNGSAYPIGTVVLVVDDPATSGDPVSQVGTTMEIVFPTIGPGDVEEGEAVVHLSHEPAFALLTRMTYLLFTDVWGQHWATNGSRTWRKPAPARVC